MMRFSLNYGVALGLLVAMGQLAAAKEIALTKDAEVCGEYGTSVIFTDSPSEAAKQALKEEKLVFVLHVSGLFEDSDFT